MASPRRPASPRCGRAAGKVRHRVAGHGEQSDQIRPADCSRPLPLSFAQQRLWFIEEFEPGQASYNSALSMRLTGSLHVAALTSALHGVAARHESLRTTFQDIDGQGVQIIHPVAEPAMPLADLSRSANTENALNRLLSDECSAPFDLRPGPLLRALLVRLSGEDHVLLITAHHHRDRRLVDGNPGRRAQHAVWSGAAQ